LQRTRDRPRLKGRSHDGLTSKIHVVVDANGLAMQLGLTPARLTKIGSARIYWRDCSRNPCCWQIASMTPTGSERSSISRALEPIFRRSASERSQFASAVTYIPRAQSRRTLFNMINQCRRIAIRQTRSQRPRFRQAGSHPHLAACQRRTFP